MSQATQSEGSTERASQTASGVSTTGPFNGRQTLMKA